MLLTQFTMFGRFHCLINIYIIFIFYKYYIYIYDVIYNIIYILYKIVIMLDTRDNFNNIILYEIYFVLLIFIFSKYLSKYTFIMFIFI